MATQSAQGQGHHSVRTLAKLVIPIILIFICVAATTMLLQRGYLWYIVAIPTLVLIFIIIIGGYTSSFFDWTGFGSEETKSSIAIKDSAQQKSTTTVERQPRKTLWDWMSLLIVPIVLALVVSAFNAQQNQINQQLSNRLHDTDIQNQKIQERAATLETYLDRMSDLLITYHLHGSSPGDEVRRVADARTFTALQSLDGTQKGTIIRFLHEADLITAVPNSYAIVRLDKVDLTGAILTTDCLDNVDLHDTFMNNADLSQAILFDSNLSISILDGANLSHSDLNNANLHWSHFIQSRLIGADLIGANLRGAILIKTDLSGANLSNADLSCYISPNDLTTKYCVNLNGADLTGVDQSGANLTGATVTQQQLLESKSLKGTIMPDGSIHS